MANDASNNPSIQERIEGDKKTFIEALKETPIIQWACKKSGVSRPTYYRWRNDDPVFRQRIKEAEEQGRELICDMSEIQVIAKIKDGSMPAIVLWLRHNDPRYGAKKESQAKASPFEELSPEEKRIFDAAIALATGVTPASENNNDGDQQSATQSGGDLEERKAPAEAGV